MVVMIEMVVQGLSNHPKLHCPIVWLRGLSGKVMLPLSVGDTAAVEIYRELTYRRPARPLTHDLVLTVLGHFHARVAEVNLVEVRDGTLYAELILSVGDERFRLDSQANDAIVLALKCGAPIYLSEALLPSGNSGTRQTPGGLLLLESLGREQQAVEPEESIAQAADDLLSEMHVKQSREMHRPMEDPRRRLASLKRRLKLAVGLERYEEAAAIQKAIDRVTEEQQPP